MAKLKEAGVIQEITYPEWASNLVIVSREDSAILRMCIDFTSLNYACPKDSYLTPPVDRLVDSTEGHVRLSFLDAYSFVDTLFCPDL